MANIKHGLSVHAHFKRWNNIVQRCYNPNHHSYKHYGAVGVKVDWVWHPDNPEGVKNFIDWLEQELQTFQKDNPKLNNEKLEIGRMNMTAGYSPANCVVRVFGQSTRMRKSSALTADIVVQLRHYKRHIDPNISNRDLMRRFDLDHTTDATVSRALSGATWSIVNCQEPPIRNEQENEENNTDEKRSNLLPA